MFKTMLMVTLSIVLLSTCAGRRQLDAKAYMKWFSDADNGLTRTKQVNGYLITLKYIPAEYLIYKEFNGMVSATVAKKDSIAEYYKHNLNFVLSISPTGSDDEGRNILYDKIEKFEDYKSRVFDINFDVENLIELKLDEGVSLAPSIYNVENTYGLSKELNFNLVFSPQASMGSFDQVDQIDLVFSDYIFETGISHFVFDKKDLKNLPILL